MNKGKKHSVAGLRFRRWDRNKYSVFNSIKKRITIGVLALCSSLAITPKCSKAQTDSSENIRKEVLEEYVVSADPAPLLYSESARIVHIISKEEIEQAPLNSLDALLEYTSQLDIRQRGGMDVQSDISIRGGSSEQVAILLNGINISDPQTGHHQLNLPFDLSAIDHIEILEGSSSRIYGAGAFSGAINIITQPKSTNNKAELNLSGGSFGYRNISLNKHLQTGKIHHFTNISHKAGDGYIRNTDFTNSSIFYHALMELKNQQFEVQAGYTTKSFGANAFYTPAYPDQFESIRSKFASIKYSSGTWLKFTFSGYWRRLHDRFELFRYEAADWYTGHNYHRSDLSGIQSSLVYTTAAGKTSIGFDVRDERIKSNVLGYEMPEALPAKGSAFFTKQDARQNAGVYIEHSLVTNSFTASAGALIYWHSRLEGAHIFPGLDVSYSINEHFKAFASVNHSLRMPTFTDLFYEGPTNKGNPNLKPETSTNIETGIKFNTKGTQAYLLGFYRNGKNIIDWVRQSEDDIWLASNLTELNTSGLSLAINMQPFLWERPISIIKNISISYSYIIMEKESGQLLSKYALDYLKHKLDFSLRHKIWSKLNANWLLSWQDRNGQYIKYEAVKSSSAEYKAFALLNLRLSWMEKKWQIYTEANNLFNTLYYDFGNIAQPGRWIICGISLKLG